MLTVSTAHAQLCGPDVQHSTKRMKVKADIELSPPAEKALVYVLAPTYEGGTIQNKVSADRMWIGINQYHSYFIVALDPGPHDFCTKSGKNANHLVLDLVAGKTYYLKQDLLYGMGLGRKATMLSQVTAEDAAVLLKKCTRIIFWEKGKPEPR